MTDAGTKTSGFIAAICRYRLGVITLWILGIAASALVYLANFRIDNSVAIWFLEGDPELQDYRRFHDAFGEEEWTYVWLKADDSVFEPAFLRDLQELSTQIESLDNVRRVLSLTTVGGIEAGRFGIPIFDPFYSMAPGTLPLPDQADALRQKVRANPLFEGWLVSSNTDRFTVLAVQNVNRLNAIEPYRIRLIDEIRGAVSTIPAISDFGIAGTTVVNAELNRAARRDMLIYYGLIAVFVVVGGWITLRRIRDVMVLCAVVVGTILPVLGAIGAFGLPFNLMTVMLPTLLVTVSVSYLIHFLGEFHDQRHGLAETLKSTDPSVAIAATFRRLLRPGLWTTVTTAIGFASLAVSPVAPIRHLGLFAALGIVLAWLNTITVAPALLSLFWKKEAPSPPRPAPNQKSARLIQWLALPHPGLAIILGVSMLAGAAGLVRLEADTDYVKFFRPDSLVRNDYAQLDRIHLPASYLTIAARLPEHQEVPHLERHHDLREFEAALLRLPAVLGIQSLDETVAQLASTLAGNSAHDTVIQLLLARATSGQSEDLAEFVSRDGTQLQLRAMTGPMSTRDINEFRDQLANLATAQLPDWNVSVTGTNVLWANMDAHVVRTQLLSIGITASFLLLLLPFVFRSIALGLIGFVVSFVPVLCTLGLMAWIGLPVNIATCLLGGVVIGIAVDDTIYFLSRVREGLQIGLPTGEAAQRAIGTTGRAMIKTSLILTGGFLTMAASDFLPSVYFGLFFAFSILVALLADLVVLPALLRGLSQGSSSPDEVS